MRKLTLGQPSAHSENRTMRGQSIGGFAHEIFPSDEQETRRDTWPHRKPSHFPKPPSEFEERKKPFASQNDAPLKESMASTAMQLFCQAILKGIVSLSQLFVLVALLPVFMLAWIAYAITLPPKENSFERSLQERHCLGNRVANKAGSDRIEPPTIGML